MFKFFLAFVCLFAVSDSLYTETHQKTQEIDIEKLPTEKFADEDPSVGSLGDTAKIKFSGQQQLTPEVLRNVLALDLEYQTAARPSASLPTLLETLENRLQEGLLHSGFLHGTAQVNFEANAIHVHIKEGPRFKNAGLRITGAKTIDAKLFERTLLDPAIPSNWKYQIDEIALDRPPGFDSSDNDWKESEAIQADSQTLLQLRQWVFKALLNQGYPHAKFKIDVVPNDNDAAQYVIAIEDEGPQGTIEEIVVKGLERHSEDQILEFLNLSPGISVNAELLDGIHEKLRDSCRFWKYQEAVRVFDPKRDRYATTPKGVMLSIALAEYPFVPPLDEPLSEAEEVMKRCAYWLENYTQQESAELGDLVIEKQQTQIPNDWMDCSFHLNISPSHDGTLFRATSPAPWAIDYSLLYSTQELSLFSYNDSQKWTLASSGYVPTVSIKCSAGDLEDKQYKNRLNLGFGWKSDRSNSQPTLQWEIGCEPVAMVNLLYRHESKYEFQGDELHITTAYMKLRIDRETGALRHVSLMSPDTSLQECGSITFRKNAFANAIKELQAKTSKFDERCDPELPLTSFAQFALDQLLAQPFVKETDIWRIPLKAVRNETKSGCLDEMLADYRTMSPFSSSRDDRFKLPKRDSADDDDFSQEMVRLTPFLADYLFPHGSWPWTLTRELGFGYRSGSEEDATENRAREIDRITRDEKTGVLGNLSAVLFAKYFLPKIPAEQLMTMKKSEINEARFLQDVRLLVKGDTGSALVAHKLVDLLATFPESELTALKDDLPASWYAALTTLKLRRETHPNETPAESIEAVAAICWNSSLGEYVTSPYKNTATDFSETAEANQSSRR